MSGRTDLITVKADAIQTTATSALKLTANPNNFMAASQVRKDEDAFGW